MDRRVLAKSHHQLNNPENHKAEHDQVHDNCPVPAALRLAEHGRRSPYEQKAARRLHNRGRDDARLVKRSERNTEMLRSAEEEHRCIQAHYGSEQRFHGRD